MRAARLPPAAEKGGNLRPESSSFVGRRPDLVQARRLLSLSPLVTLTGAGGVGKTRLALRVARHVRRAFEAVWLVEWGSLQAGARPADTVASTLGLAVAPGTDPSVALVEHLAARRVLLVLDTCEHLADDVAVLVHTLLRACPQLRILATSREPLGVPGEETLCLRPLPVPQLRTQSVRALSQVDAVALLVQRVAAGVPGFALTADNGAAVAEACRRLDGLPLAIELAIERAAAQPEAGYPGIIDLLPDLRPLPAPQDQGRVPRHRTMRACVEWSHRLCSPPEQLLWARLSVFEGTFELDAVEAVCGGGELAREDLLDVVAALVDKSVLMREEQGVVAQYRLLGAIRAFGEEKACEVGDQVALRRRHRNWYRRLVLPARPECAEPLQPSTGAPGGTPVPWPTTLTEREREVADLVARGLTNREIALQLVIAQRTAEGHVESIMAKLGVTSRTQIALRSARRARPPAGG